MNHRTSVTIIFRHNTPLNPSQLLLDIDKALVSLMQDEKYKTTVTDTTTALYDFNKVEQ